MTGNIALDIFISLAFIYLLYSLYTTILVEMLASVFRLRAGNLRFAIRRMLTDNDNTNIVIVIKKLKKYLLRIIQWKTLLQVQLSKFTIVVLLWIIRWPKSLRSGLKNVLARLNKTTELKSEDFIEVFFNQPTLKYLAKPGLLSGKGPSYLSQHNFSKALLDSLKKNRADETLVAKIKNGIEQGNLEPDTQNHLYSLLEDANFDMQKFIILIERWFNDTMERSIGWYKQTIQKILFVVGFAIAVIFNLNTIHIARLLSNNSEARNQLVLIAVESQAKYGKQVDLLAKVNSKDSLDFKELKKQLDTLSSVKKDIENDIEQTRVLFGGGWNLPGKLTITDKKPYGKDYYFRCKGGKPFYILKPEVDYNLDSIAVTRSFGKVRGKSSGESNIIEANYEFKPTRYKVHYMLRNFLGYLLTALAISLGAPFWFDLLNKLVKLRGSVRQSVEAEGATAASTPGKGEAGDILNRKG